MKNSTRIFIETALPGGWGALDRPVHVQRPLIYGGRFHGYSNWYRPDYKLTPELVEDHLAGRCIVATTWPDLVGCFEFDVDAKTPEARETLDDRVWRLLGLFYPDLSSYRRGPVEAYPSWTRTPGGPAMIWRSTRGGGARVRFILDKPYRKAEIRARVVQHLEANGLRLRPGEIELWPDGNRTLRLPLGAGTSLLDFEDLLFEAHDYERFVPAGKKLRGG